MRDLIDRQAAIDFIDAGHFCNPNEPRWSDNEVVNFLKSRPSAEPERKTGKWIKKVYFRQTTQCYDCEMKECSECHAEWSYDVETGVSEMNYCPNCGADMRQEAEHDA